MRSSILFILLGVSSCLAQTGAKQETTNIDLNQSETATITPPQFWKEHWFEHNQELKLQAYNDDVAIYYDEDVDQSITWPLEFFTKTWSYIKKTYGDFGEENRLYVILHEGKYGGGHPSVYRDESHDYRNVLDAGINSWSEKDPKKGLSIAVHEIGHIVEGITNGLKYNPAWEIWKDSKWAEIFIYDVYKNTGETQFAQDLFKELQYQKDDFPKANTYWFKDWFYPVYSQYGESDVLADFYNLLDSHFPKNQEETRFSRRMNMGEFIHFWSGAAKHDLRELAQNAFGWNAEWESQLKNAKMTFPDVTY